MKTSIIVKVNETQQLANNPVSYSKYVNSITTAMKKADRMGGLELGKILSDVRDNIIDGAKGWEKYTAVADFAESECNISKSRCSQLITGYHIFQLYSAYVSEKDFDGFVCDEMKTAVNESFTVSHFYELKTISEYDANIYFSNGTFTVDMSVSELKKTIKELNEISPDDSDETNDSDNDTDDSDDTDDTDENTLEIRNADDAESLYKDILKKLERGEILTIKIATV